MKFIEIEAVANQSNFQMRLRKLLIQTDNSVAIAFAERQLMGHPLQSSKKDHSQPRDCSHCFSLCFLQPQYIILNRVTMGCKTPLKG